MGFFDLFKSKEERERIEWDNLSDREKCNRIKKEKEEDRKRGEVAKKKEMEWEEMKSGCLNRIITPLKQHPGEHYTEKMIMEIARPRNEDERSCYKGLLLHKLYDYGDGANDYYWETGEALKNEGIQLIVYNDTEFYTYK